MEKTTELLEKFANKLSEVVSQYGPQAADFALAVGRVDAANKIMSGLIYAAVAVCGAVALRYIVRLAIKSIQDEDETMIPPIVLGGFISCTALLTGSIVSLHKLTNAYVWVGMFKPEIYLAAKALGWI